MDTCRTQHSYDSSIWCSSLTDTKKYTEMIDSGGMREKKKKMEKKESAMERMRKLLVKRDDYVSRTEKEIE